MESESLIDTLLSLNDAVEQRQILEAHPDVLGDEFASALKARADHFLRADIQRSFDAARLLMLAAEVSGRLPDFALGLLAEANAHSLGLGQYQRALELYNQATEIYQAHGRIVEQARAQIGKLYALSFLGRYAEVLETSAWARDILAQHAQWQPLATLTMNLAITYGRMGQDAEALALFDQAGSLYRQLGAQGASSVPLVEQNRAIVLRNLGRFDLSIQASQHAREGLHALGQTVEAARAQQNLAITYFVLGRYNQALALLDQAREVFLADRRQRDAILIELFTSDCLLHLRRFGDVLDKCREVRQLFTERGTRFEVGQALLDEAVAYAGLRRYDQALSSLAEACALFEAEGNAAWSAASDLERAAVLVYQGQPEAGLAVAQSCIEFFGTHDLPLKQAQAYLLAARAAAALAQTGRARALAAQALALGERLGLATLTYAARHLIGTSVREAGDPQAALAYYHRAIQDLEQLRGQLMIEFRADFLEDKRAVYEDTVGLCIELGQPLRALEYAERAKSRALIDLLAHRLDLSIQARSDDDAPLVAELSQLRSERDRLARRWESREATREQGVPSEQERQQSQQTLLALERRITELWHRLLIRNADYARDAAIWQVRGEPIQPYLDTETLLLEYFIVRGKLVAFLVTRDSVQVHQLPGTLAGAQQAARLLRLNMSAVSAANSAESVAGLEQNARGLLGQLYQQLLAPFAAAVAGYQHLVIVPHGPLHYVPFHALHDGQHYLLEQHEISYLPGASLLRYTSASSRAVGRLALGYSYGGKLPHAVAEARAVASVLGGETYLEQAATLARLRAALATCQVVHLASHGDFRPDNPLFSGLALADGWLTTLEIFNLHLGASLVTLSACQTGRSTVGGGDELLGLMRALLYAGAASLLLSLWTVEDRSTALLMQTFYGKLAEGSTKGAALRHAQLRFIGAAGAENDLPRLYAHPYFWAPFFLTGNAGAL
jgi:CHAT domain-containing protein